MQALFTKTRAYNLIENERSRGELGHAYLIVLDDERNLRAALKVFAKLFFDCEKERTEGEKRVSRLIDGENFSDCLFFPEDGKKFVVEDAEAITEESTLKPVECDEKLFVIADFASATPAAQNKLLKLFEEPPQGVRFLIGATSAFPVLSTVLSRVKTLEVPPFTETALSACLSRTYADAYPKTDIELCAAASGGYLGAAQNMLEGGAYKNLVDEAFALAATNERELPIFVKKTGETKRKKELLSLLRMIYRDALVLKTARVKSVAALQNSVLLKSEKQRLEAVAEAFSLSALVFAQEAITKAEREVAFNAYFPQCLEVLIASILRENQRN